MLYVVWLNGGLIGNLVVLMMYLLLCLCVGVWKIWCMMWCGVILK